MVETQRDDAEGLAVARQSGWEGSDNQDGRFGGRGEVMIVAARTIRQVLFHRGWSDCRGATINVIL
jgi:hypothetical protein